MNTCPTYRDWGCRCITQCLRTGEPISYVRNGCARAMTTLTETAQEVRDRELEGRIASAALRVHASPDPGDRMAAFDELRRLIAQRSPERVREMEHRRGLR